MSGFGELINRLAGELKSRLKVETAIYSHEESGIFANSFIAQPNHMKLKTAFGMGNKKPSN